MLTGGLASIVSQLHEAPPSSTTQLQLVTLPAS
jgi:hypothetical protein